MATTHCTAGNFAAQMPETITASTPGAARRPAMNQLPALSRGLVIAFVSLACLTATVVPTTIPAVPMQNKIVLAGVHGDPLPGAYHWGIRGLN